MKKTNQTACFLIFFWVFLNPSAIATDWRIITEESSVEFSGTQTGVAFSGKFTRFGADISFVPADPASAHVKAEIDLASATTGDTQRDTALPQEDWFFVSAFPKATFEATGFQPQGDNRYSTVGTLTLKGITKTVPLSFTLTFNGGRALMQASLTLNRADFSVGAGPWAEGKWVGLNVDVSLNIVAERKEP
jgi:polyisoprenoid-binding protein YceI